MDQHDNLDKSTVVLNRYESDEFLDFEYQDELKNAIKALNMIRG